MKIDDIKDLEGQLCLDCSAKLVKFYTNLMECGYGWRCPSCGTHYTVTFYKQLARDLDEAYRLMTGESTQVLSEEHVISGEAEIRLGEDKVDGISAELLKIIQDTTEEEKSDALEKFEKPIDEV